MLALLPLILQASSPAIVTSVAPEAVAVTVYRDPDRGQQSLELGNVDGRALITETRTVDLPAGPAEIRFEGVADGIVPVSAIITGLPGGTVEKNRDARLLSPAALVDGTLGRHVHIRWTHRRSGRVQEENARIVAGPSDGVVLQTSAGFMALRCSGLSETPIYDAVPSGLSAKPTLSVRTVSPVAGKATVRLSYLADDFDWQADYIARLDEGTDKLTLFAWLTLANGNGVSFDRAETMAVAGRIEQDRDAPTGAMPAEAANLSLRCWPMQTTSDIPVPPPPPPPPPPLSAPMMAGEIIVTARRRAELLSDVPMAVMVATQENLGDLKLYRIPEPVTVAANSQKQVALLNRRDVPYETVYALLVQPEGEDDVSTDAEIILRLQNREKDGLGLPLPAGPIAVLSPRGDRDLRVGEGIVADTAVGQEANLSIGKSTQVQGQLSPAGKNRWRYVVSNANPFAVMVEAVLASGSDHFRGKAGSLPKRNGMPLWTVKVPANGTRSMDLVMERDKP